MSLEAVAVDYLDRGLSIVPLLPNSKRPAGRWKHLQHAPIARSHVRAWWGRNSPHGLGIVTGAISHDLCVLDIEPEHRSHVVKRFGLARANAVTTARGGVHVYCRAPAQSGPLVVEGVHIGDVRGNGGYVVAPPTRMTTGAYAWADRDADFDALPPAPGWALDALALRGSRPPSELCVRQLVVGAHALADIQLIDRVSTVIRSMLLHRTAQTSHSETDFAIVCEAIRVGADLESVEDLFDRYAPDRISSRVGKGDPTYLARTYNGAVAEVETERATAIRARILQQCVATTHQIRRLCLRLGEVNGPRTWQHALPIDRVVDGCLAPAGDFYQFCAAFRAPITRPSDPGRGHGRVAINSHGLRFVIP